MELTYSINLNSRVQFTSMSLYCLLSGCFLGVYGDIKFIRIIMILFISLVSNTVFAHLPDSKDIDKRINGQHIFYLGDPDKFMAESLIILQDSRKIQYSRGIAIASLRIATVLDDRGEFKKANFYLRISNNEAYTKKNRLFKSFVTFEICLNLSQFGLMEESITKYRLLGNKNGDPFVSGASWGKMTDCFIALNLMDSTLINDKKGYNLLAASNVYDAKVLFSIMSSHIGNDFTMTGKNDSAEFYLLKGLSVAKQTKHPLAIAIATESIGVTYLKNHSADSAIFYLQQSLYHYRKINHFYEIADVYRFLSSAYRLSQNLKESDRYQSLYFSLSQKLAANKKYSGGSYSVVGNENVNSDNKGIVIIAYVGIISFILIMLVLLLYFKIKKYKKAQNLLIKEKQDLIESVSEIKNIAETEILGSLIELAKTKDPAFFVKFNEVYPGFRGALISKYPDLTVNDIEFCAYLRMNFKTKEIARYADLTVRSVEYRKYRLRKIMNISSSEDINLFVTNI